MALVKPRYSNAGGSIVLAFKGAIQAKTVPHATRTFMVEVTFDTHHLRLAEIMQFLDKKPPAHFHPYQTKFFQVLEGNITIKIDGKARVITPSDGEVHVNPWVHHRSYSAPVTQQNITKFLINGSDTLESNLLDTVFIQNWYGYQDQVVLYGGKVDPIQVLSMFDASGSCLSLPWYVPFNRTISRVLLGVIIGRWLGGLLEYQPFHKE
ncbi:hypothetical protein AOQ84DRAFT_370878 [Glonium stellatum]|uniref:Uncharacterized protein n=1 Tax=Glonium stellatum TaxID=574774 RepID=A0A8E2FCY9_9PEZI|nr:hypothetical protein AOQ84DRAFT_370878 [Glonium stellatum]